MRSLPDGSGPLRPVWGCCWPFWLVRGRWGPGFPSDEMMSFLCARQSSLPSVIKVRVDCTFWVRCTTFHCCGNDVHLRLF